MIAGNAVRQTGIEPDDDWTYFVQVWSVLEVLDDLPGSIEANDALASAAAMFRGVLTEEGVSEAQLRAVAVQAAQRDLSSWLDARPPDDVRF